MGFSDLDTVVENPHLVPLLVDVLDQKGIDLHGIRFDADEPEEWVYFNNPFGEEVSEFLKPIER